MNDCVDWLPFSIPPPDWENQSIIAALSSPGSVTHLHSTIMKEPR